MGLREDLRKDPVSSLELRPVITARPDDPVRTAVQRMKEAQLGCVVIVDDNGMPLGRFTERLLVRVLAFGEHGLDHPISKYMIPAEAMVTMNEPVSRVITLMRDTGVRFVFVADEQGKVIALTGLKGVMKYLAEHFPRQIKSQVMEAKLYMDQREGA